MHVDSDDDKFIQGGFQHQQYWADRYGCDGTEISTSSANAIQRKPLRQDRELLIDERPELPSTYPSSKPSTQDPKSSIQIGRKPVGQSLGLGTPVIGSLGPSLPTPLGPRPMHRHAQSEYKEALETRPERRNVDVRRWSKESTHSPQSTRRPNHGQGEETPYPPPRPITRSLDEARVDAQVLSHREQYLGETNGIQMNNLNHSQYERDFSLTLIRRHDNLQQNVAKISRISQSGHWGKSINNNGRLEGNQDKTLIEILTPGYAKFTEREASTDYKNQYEFNELQNGPQDSYNDNCEQFSFKRHLQARNHSKASDQRRSISPQSLSSKHGLRSKFKIRRHQKTSSDDKSENIQPKPTHQSIDSKGYMFHSPWNGKCEFHTGIAGRSLKCKHTLSNPQAGSAPVSELRFNLPSSKALAASPRRTMPPRSTQSSPSTSLPFPHHPQPPLPISPVAMKQQPDPPPNHHQNPPPSSFSSDRMDLSLGQERAGGGFGGKRAKLGKLVVENEGLRMLDLVVAANVGVWWRVYGKGGREDSF